MKKITWIGFISILLLTVGGCSKWLDVKPDNVVNEEEIYTDRKGFQSALAGVYYDLARSDLYGRELKAGFMDALVGYYTITSSSHVYIEATRLDFTHADIRPIVDTIWNGLYTGINSVNIILKNVDNIKQDPNYTLVKGEALGLRAYLHLEILKNYGPVIKEDGLGTIAIPYYDQVRTEAQNALTTAQVLEHIEQDLQAALVLLENDPIKTLGRGGNGNEDPLDYNSLIDRRGIRMNYYAVLALLARKAQWEGNQTLAYERAKRVVDELKQSEAIRLISAEEIASSYQKDLRFTVENIWGLYINDFKTMNSEFLPDLQAGRHVYYALLPDFNYLNTSLYSKTGSGSPNDYRLLYWFARSQGLYRLIKFQIEESIGAEVFNEQYEVSMISLAEMYYIMAEAKLDTDPQAALDILNELRLSRNLIEPIAYHADLTKEQILQHIVDEASKQSIGEGYMYSMYKRLYMDIPRRSDIVEASKNVYVLPIPVDEQIYNPQ